MKNKNFGRKRQAIYILSNRKSTRIIKTLMDFFFFIKVKIKMVCFSVPSLILEGWVSFFVFFLHNRIMNILQEIFTDHYEEIKYTLHPRPAEMENIDKMINCGDPSYGGAMYGCIHCGNLKFVPFRCHSRFCPTCGNKYSMDRTTSMSFKLVNVRHRHCVFTIDASLRDFFLQDRSLLNCLFHSVSSVVLRLFSKMNKHKNFTPGFIMVLHTFGRDLKWNPHIHCLISEGGYSDDAFWRNVSHFNYTFLRNAFRTAILSSFGYNPLICPHCKQQMVILEIYHNHHRVPLEDLYEKAMSRSRGKRSSA